MRVEGVVGIPVGVVGRSEVEGVRVRGGTLVVLGGCGLLSVDFVVCFRILSIFEALVAFS